LLILPYSSVELTFCGLLITKSFSFLQENGKHLENKTIHNDLITVRREKLRSPVNFDHVVEGSAERSVMSLKKSSEFSEILNFENVADEDLWVTMNDGQSLMEPDFLFSTPSRWGSSVGSTKGTSSSVRYCQLYYH
jgi:hypothetical protein